MLCLFSLIFIFMVVMQIEFGAINICIGIIYVAYGLIMLYNTSKSYWDYDKYIKNKKNKKKRTNLNRDTKISSK